MMDFIRFFRSEFLLIGFVLLVCPIIIGAFLFGLKSFIKPEKETLENWSTFYKLVWRLYLYIALIIVVWMGIHMAHVSYQNSKSLNSTIDRTVTNQRSEQMLERNNANK